MTVTDVIRGMREASSSERRGFTVYWTGAVTIVALTALARVVAPSLFAGLAGGADPVLAAAVIAALGAALLCVLRMVGGFLVLRPAPARGLLRATAFAAAFGSFVIVVDAVLTHPVDMNVPFPGSLLFYPAISLMAEVLFHLLPLAALLVVWRGVAGDVDSAVAVRASLLVTALIEPSFQVLALVRGTPIVGEPRPLEVDVAVFDWLHVAAINVCQVYLFRRYDFMSMWTFRLVYYAVWHIAWGALRLGLLF